MLLVGFVRKRRSFHPHGHPLVPRLLIPRLLIPRLLISQLLVT